MANERCQNSNHEWYCKKVSGDLGEKREYLPLSTQAVLSVLDNLSKADEVCPGGTIVCGKCEIPLVADANQQPAFNINDLNDRLIKKE